MSTTTRPTVTAFPAVSQQDATVLILGSMPGVASLNAQKYYAHPRNAFWFIMQSLFGSSASDDGAGLIAHDNYTDKINRLKQSRVALWDVLSECSRTGSLDSNIDKKSIRCNDFNEFFASHQQLTVIAFNGKMAEQLYRKHVLPELNNSPETRLVSLPSSSPAMAMMTREEKANAWREQLINT